MFSQEWEATYSSGLHDSVWPWSDLVSSVMRNLRKAGVDFKASNVLELGCGAGANVGFFNALGCSYHGIDGSPSVVSRLKTRFKDHKNIRFSAMDFTAEVPNEKFNIVVDRSSLTHNTTSAIKRSLELCRAHATPDAFFFGIDWFSTTHSDSQQGELCEDKYTRTNAKSGQFPGLGRVHFSDEAHLVSVFDQAGWRIESLEHKVITDLLPESGRVFAAYNLMARPK